MRTIHGYISDYVKSLNYNGTYVRLSPVKKLLLKLLGVVKLEEVYVKTPIGTERGCEVYLVRCPKCRELHIDYYMDTQNSCNALTTVREFTFR